ncbi:MAG: hypothetical protein JKY73_00815 [Lutibacter sp.]|nr:hypothetical protein [Lutibacter sp.]
MKPLNHIIKTIALLAIVFSCTNNSDQSQEEDLNELNNLKEEVEQLITTGNCTENANCSYIAFGSKPCGGPWSFLVYSTNIDTDLLISKVSNYNQLENEYNIKWGIISDCSTPTPPTSVECIEEKCKGIYN